MLILMILILAAILSIFETIDNDKYLKIQSNLVLGAMDNIQYSTATTKMLSNPV